MHHLQVEDLNQLLNILYSSQLLLSLLLQNINFKLPLSLFLLKKINNSYFPSQFQFVYF